jgi:Tfp pilus assembly protein PilO
MNKSQPVVNTKQPVTNIIPKGQPLQASKPLKPKKGEETVNEVAEVESGEKTSILKPGILVRAAVLAIINLIAVAAIVFLMGRLELKAQEVKRLRSLHLGGASNQDPFSTLSAEIEGSETKVNELVSYFPDSQGLIAFVGEIDKLKAEGVVTNFSFAKEEPIKDKTGALGLPVVIDLRGTWPQIDSALGRIMSLPYFIRTIRVDAAPSQEDSSLVDFKFGGFLYVE